MTLKRDAQSLQYAELAMREGRLLAAYDSAIEAIKFTPDSLRLKQTAILALARSGFTKRAAKLFDDLFPSFPDISKSKEALVIKSLKARIEKDWGLKSSGEKAQQHFLNSAKLYTDAFLETGDTYPGVNAASLWLWAGKIEKSKTIAKQCLKLNFVDTYYGNVSKAELYLILGDLLKLENALISGIRHNPSVDKRVTTYRQLLRSCDLLKYDKNILLPIKPGPLLRYLGNMPWENWDQDAEANLKNAVTSNLKDCQYEKAFGSLAAGSDIIIAEEVLRQNIPLTIILPLSKDKFIKASVESFGVEWVNRFETCISKASEVKYSCETDQPIDGISFRHCSHVTLGFALNSAKTLMTNVYQLAIWNGVDKGKAGGTAEDIKIWSNLGKKQTVISKSGEFIPYAKDMNNDHIEVTEQREIRSVLFGDFVGYSRLTEEQIKSFTEVILRKIADILSAFGSKVLSANTWGDGLFIIFEDVESAGGAAEIISNLDLLALAPELPILELRLGLHMGPMTRVTDPITNNITFVGTEVTRASRIEPVTPPGSIFVTEAFASHAAISAAGMFEFEYMGQVVLAKTAGTTSIFRLVISCVAGS